MIPGIVDERMNGFVPILDKTPDRVQVRQIERTDVDPRIDGFLLEALRDLFGRIRAAGSDCDRGTRRSEAFHRFDPDSARPAGDDHGLAGQVDTGQHVRCIRGKSKWQVLRHCFDLCLGLVAKEITFLHCAM